MPNFNFTTTQKNKISPNNFLNVTFNLNKFQDNLLSKRIQKLDNEEMKIRLKHQRTSNELLMFLRECQQTTGYHSKTKPDLKTIERNDETRRFSQQSDITTTTATTSTSSLSTFNSAKNLIESSSDFLIESKIIEVPKKVNCVLIKPGIACKIPLFQPKSPVSSTSRSDTSISTDSLHDSYLTDDNDKNRRLISSLIRPVTCGNFKQRPKMKKLSLTSSNLDWPNKFSLIDDELNDFTLQQQQQQQQQQKHKNSIQIDEDFKPSKKSSIKKQCSKKESKVNNFSNPNIEFQSKSLNFLFSNDTLKNMEEKINLLNLTTSSVKSQSSSSSSDGRKTSVASKNGARQQKQPQQQVFPIRINMSKNFMRKKQLEIMSEYKRSNDLEMVNNLRQIQKGLDLKVKEFACQETF